MSDTGRTSERLESLQERWQADRGSRVFLQLADEYRRLGRAEDAVRVLEEGLRENPRHPAAQVALGRCRLELGRAADATEVLEQVVESDPTQMVAYRLLVDAYVAQGKPEEARQRLRIYGLLNDSDPEIAELRRRIGQLERQDRPDEGAVLSAPPEDLMDEPLEPLAEAEPAPGDPAPAAAPTAPEDPLEAAGTPAPAGDPSDPPREVPESEPFPGLSAAVAGPWRAGPGDDLFDLGPLVPRAAEPAPDLAEPSGEEAGEPFGLELATPPPGVDLASLLGGEPAAAGTASGERSPEPWAPLPAASSGLAAEHGPGESAAPPEPAALTPAADAAGRPTVTLGLLYLRQGHTREAEEIFHAVLDRDPDNAEALRHLEEIGEQLRAELGEPRRLTASDLLEGWPGEEREGGMTQRKRFVLERYRERISGRARRDVH